MAYNINDLIEIIGEEGASKIQPSFFYATITKNYPQIELSFKGMIIFTEQIKYTAWAKYLAESEIKSGLKKGDTVLIKNIGDSVLIIDKVVI